MEYLTCNKEELKDLIEAMSKDGGWPAWTTEQLFETAQEWGLLEEGHQDVYLEFAKMYLAYRRGMKHRGISLIKPGNRQWKMLIEVCDEAIAFYKENNLEKRQGFKLFLDVAGQVTQSMRLQEIRRKADHIHEHFVALAIIEGDQNTKITNQIYDEYEKRYVVATGDHINIALEPLQLQYFVEAAELCREYKYRAKDFVGMVFNEFAWLGVPKPYHLVGAKAKELVKRGHDAKFGAKRIKRVSLKHITQKDDTVRD